ncbi:hypothetical protein PR202_gb09250 [Eleusine coracana subsp. coracana]|uniref:Uncharacterized protein n=1 Tax=Eleusine coracana subsp. coracana TaxID=191504 RepID=A0AAV5EG87_ELECO|nr:hypothetical protein PR202_gb09250 [Eleusine coracana subsp. coracana]
MTQEPTSLLPVWARTPTTRRPKPRRHSHSANAVAGAMEEDHHHRPSSSPGRRSFLSGLCASALRRKPLGASASTAASGEGLVRQLGVLELVLLGIGASIGAGIFVVTGTVARDAGPGVTISFMLAGAACVLNALCYAELASRFPAVVGGAYLYTYAAFNELTAFLVFTQLMLDYHIGAASIARSLASYFIQFVELIPFFKGHIPSWIGHGEEFFGGVISINILAPILLIILTAILCYGVKESSAVNTFMTTLKRDLPIGILGSLLACVILYVAVCLVITGMVPYTLLGEDAPLAEAFAAKGLKFITVLISIGAVAGLTTTLLVGLYVQSRLYLGLGRDGLLPSIFAKVHPTRHTPLHSQIWVGCVAAVMAGLCYRYNYSIVLMVVAFLIAVAASFTLQFRQVYVDPPGFSCPGVPIVPIISVFFNMLLFAQVCSAFHFCTICQNSCFQIHYGNMYYHYGGTLLPNVLDPDLSNTLPGSYTKKRGTDLSSLVLSLWDCMRDMVSTTPILTVQTTLLSFTMEFLRKLHDPFV